jgi:4,5-DOPA dioxygenase extradiol
VVIWDLNYTYDDMTHAKRTPLLFVGHGNPMNAISDNRYTQEWERIGRELGTPEVIVCMSAHWLTNGSFITSSLKPEIIYDFYGFPDELYHVTYPAPGNPKLAAQINQAHPEIAIDTMWGLDHGTWSVLKKMFPKATIPVLQLSIDMSVSPKAQYDLMVKLKYLREKNILFFGSGNIVHNLGLAAMDRKPFNWALEFEDIAKNLIEKGDVNSLINYEKLGNSATLSIPTEDHYRPMLNTLALKFTDETPVFFNQGIDLASVSMLSFKYQ